MSLKRKEKWPTPAIKYLCIPIESVSACIVVVKKWRSISLLCKNWVLFPLQECILSHETFPFWTTPLGLILALHSGISPGCSQGTIWTVKNQTWISCKRAYTVDPVKPSWDILVHNSYASTLLKNIKTISQVTEIPHSFNLSEQLKIT